MPDIFVNAKNPHYLVGLFNLTKEILNRTLCCLLKVNFELLIVYHYLSFTHLCL